MRDVLDAFLEQVKSHPDRLAVSENGLLVTYADLHECAARLAHMIASRGEHQKVLILLDQGWLAYASIIAVLLAGGIYAPINTQAPTEKIKLIADQFEPDVVLTAPSVSERFPTLQLSGFAIDVTKLGTTLIARPRNAHELMYVMFTSGSTGVPKGVMIRRDSMAHFITWAVAEAAPTPDDRWSQHPNIAFDMSHLDIFGCLCTGGTLIPFNTPIDRLMPAKKIREEKITLWYSVPSVVNMMAQAKQLTPENLASLRIMNFAGEALLPEQLEVIFRVRPDIEIWNTYGPTEATVTCTLLKLRADTFRSLSRASTSIGTSIPGMNVELLNGPSPDEGEMVIFGPQLAEGYWGNASLTEKAFRNVEFSGAARRGYFTGDWGQRDGDNIYFVGRIDNQVKVRGVRIELSEVDAALRRCGFLDAVTIQHEGILQAFLETDKSSINQSELAAKLGEILVPQAIPVKYHILLKFPRNSNDKIDRSALRASLERLGASAEGKL